jgi:hypothetical protein
LSSNDSDSSESEPDDNSDDGSYCYEEEEMEEFRSGYKVMDIVLESNRHQEIEDRPHRRRANMSAKYLVYNKHISY